MRKDSLGSGLLLAALLSSARGLFVVNGKPLEGLRVARPTSVEQFNRNKALDTEKVSAAQDKRARKAAKRLAVRHE